MSNPVPGSYLTPRRPLPTRPGFSDPEGRAARNERNIRLKEKARIASEQRRDGAVAEVSSDLPSFGGGRSGEIPQPLVGHAGPAGADRPPLVGRVILAC